MSNPISQLQNEIITNSCSLHQAMLKAHIIAQQLSLNDFDSWLTLELNGYCDDKQNKIPDYRTVTGKLIAKDAFGRIVSTIMMNPEIERGLCKRKLGCPVNEIQELYNTNSDSSVYIIQQPEFNKYLNDELFKTELPMQFILQVSSHLLNSVLEKIKMNLLDWLIKLDKDGIKEEDVEFTKNDSEIAKPATQQVTNHYHGNVINGNVSHSPITVGNVGSISYDMKEISELEHKIKESISTESISDCDRQDAIEMLDDIVDKAKSKKSTNVVRFALSALKDFLINAGASVTATIISQYLQ